MRKIIWVGDSTAAFNGADTFPQTGIGQEFDRYCKREFIVLDFAVMMRGCFILPNCFLNRMIFYLSNLDTTTKNPRPIVTQSHTLPIRNTLCAMLTQQEATVRFLC